MCLGICGKVVGFADRSDLLARVDIEGMVRDINLAIVADDGVRVGDWLMVHMGVATEVLNDEEAAQVRDGLDMIGPGGQTTGWS
jgi:hydrogenase expression/formation protein HypC